MGATIRNGFFVATAVAAALLAAMAPPLTASAAADPAQRMTVLVDAFGADPALHRDWGYAGLVEYGGQRILFDTGNDAAGFARNVERLGVDLGRLDAVVISHRHGDHTAGLRHLLEANPRVRIYVPDDEAFGGPTPKAFFEQPEPGLPAAMRYFGGAVPDVVPHGSAWPDGHFIRVRSAMEIAPGFRVVPNRAPRGAFAETPELSLVIDTPRGQIVVVGCSHPGIERILGAVATRDPAIRMVIGGLHQVTTPPAEVEQLAIALRDRWKLHAIAPGHCSGERAFAALQRLFGRRYVYAGVGTVIDLS